MRTIKATYENTDVLRLKWKTGCKKKKKQPIWLTAYRVIVKNQQCFNAKNIASCFRLESKKRTVHRVVVNELPRCMRKNMTLL